MNTISACKKKKQQPLVVKKMQMFVFALKPSLKMLSMLKPLIFHPSTINNRNNDSTVHASLLLHQQTTHVVTTMRWWDDESGYEKYANHDGIKRVFLEMLNDLL